MGRQLADMNTRPSRELLTDDPGDGAAPTVTVVLSGEEFMAAVLAGVEHIELNDHIILRNQDAPPWAHFEIPTTLKSITVRHSHVALLATLSLKVDMWNTQ